MASRCRNNESVKSRGRVVRMNDWSGASKWVRAWMGERRWWTQRLQVWLQTVNATERAGTSFESSRWASPPMEATPPAKPCKPTGGHRVGVEPGPVLAHQQRRPSRGAGHGHCAQPCPRIPCGMKLRREPEMLPRVSLYFAPISTN